ncbi:3-hydroxyacyl-CoA dehydrogenase NAD-binding domain-containing protein [Massilia sp. ST3]|uniref:3-hydroxyacyl-CoA dehydrogenase NAD-binding domain-containing protein n=1 Tax=Massilia sp. ST3 TaxID=2824903 RepID=UPI001B824406|nr:3-hydroxyacyl-CoA dehydrogenase NAD-binding domain-containing protein [Massilia sp. ST3]MBQ5947869.1 hypothetical protein [Massilia sp. ST3]
MSNMNDESRAALASAGSRPIGRVGIIGATTAGMGIAMALLDADVPVTLYDPERATLDEVVALARLAYRDALDKGELVQAQTDRRFALMAATTNFHHLKDCDLMVDVGAGDMASTEIVFRQLDQVAKPSSILVTTRLEAGVDRLARCTRRTGDVLGIRIPVSTGKSAPWELVPGRDTSSDSLCTVLALARQLDRVAVIADPARV